MHARVDEVLNESEWEPQDQTDTYMSTPGWTTLPAWLRLAE